MHNCNVYIQTCTVHSYIDNTICVCRHIYSYTYMYLHTYIPLSGWIKETAGTVNLSGLQFLLRASSMLYM